MDRRTPLLPDQTLMLYADPREEGQGVVFQICGERDRGRSCIVYDGSYRDSVDVVHLARLKECYPRQEGLYRNEDGRICVRAAWEEEPPAGAKGNGEERGWAAEEQPDDEEIRQMFQAVMERFGKAKDRFVDAYRTQVELSKKAGLSNRILHAFQIYYGNNTLYSVMDYTEGTDYG